MIQTIWRYFELMNCCSNRLEDLWFSILETLELDRPNKYSIFKAVHHQVFRNVVLKDPIIRQIIAQTEEYRYSGYALGGDPGRHLERIYDIRRAITGQIEQSYEKVWYFYDRSELLKQIFELAMHPIEMEEMQ